MALIIGGGISIGGQITISPEGTTPLSGPVVSYNMGDSVSYNGQGFALNFANFTGPESELTGTNYIFDISSDYANGSYGNIGLLNSGSVDIGFVNTGPLGYLSFDGNGASGGQFVDSEYVNGYNIPAGSSYTIFSVVRVNDFGAPTDPTTWKGGIVGGNQTIFGFVPPGVGAPTNYPLLYAGNDLLGGNYVTDFDTQFQPNTWYAVAVTYDVDSGTIKLYVNGVNTSTNTGIVPFSNNEPLYWGTWEGSNWLNGDLAVMSAWDRALTAGEIASYTTTYGNPYGITGARQFNDMPLQTYSQLYPKATPPTGDPTVFIVPAGVTSISLVAVGAGGGGAGADSDYYSPAGGDTYVYTAWDQRYSNFFTINTGTNINQLVFDCSTAPGNSILGNVAPGWLVTGLQINNTYPDKAFAQGGSAIAVVTGIDTNNLASVIVTLNMPIASVTGGTDSFYFQGQGIVGAQGGWSSNNQYTNGSTGPGQRAVPTIGIGGRGGVQDYLTADNVGGGGAGGYRFPGSVVAFDPNQTYIYNGNGNINTGVPQVVTSLSNYDLTATAVGNTVNGYTATGTYPISPTDKVMFSITQDIWAGNDQMSIGLCNYNANVAYYPGGDTNSIGYFDDGVVYYNDAPVVTSLPTFPDNGQIIDLAVDRSVDIMWVRVDGGYWNGNVSADPATNLGGIEIMQGTTTDPNLYLMVNVGYDTGLGSMSINTSNAYPIPSGFTFIQGDPAGGSTGGDGSGPDVPTMKPGQQADGGGSGAGGGGIYQDTGAGGGGVGLYGAGAPGTNGLPYTWVNSNTKAPPDGSGPLDNYAAMATGGQGGSTLGNSGTIGGTASLWAGGAGGWPGGAGGSGVDYYGGGNAGALAYVNNVEVTPYQAFFVIVGKGGTGSGYSGGVGGDGAVRIVWPGDTRTFPYTNVGIDSAGPSSLTIGTTDFTNGNSSGVTVNIVSGYVVSLTATSGNIGDQYAQLYGGSNTVCQNIFAFFRQLGLYNMNSLNGNIIDPLIFNAYIFNVTWADSSTGKVRMGYDANGGTLFITTVDTGSNDWQTADPATLPGPTNPVQAGTFNFPATFTLYTPTTESSGNYWC